MITYEKDSNAKISKLEEITTENENNYQNKQTETEVSKTSKMSFSKIMDMMYTQNDTIIEGNNVSIYPKCNTNMIYQDETGKITTLKEIVSIEIAGIIYPDAMEESTTLIATTYEGKKINISK